LAVEDHYARQNDSDNDPDYQDDDEPEPEPEPQQTAQAPGGGYRLGDASSTSQPVPSTAAPSSSSRPKKSSAPKKKFATLGDVGSAAKDDSDSDDDAQNFYAGGDKSGLAVQNPDQNRGSEDLKKKIIEKARKGGKEIAEEEPQKKSNFIGSARTLGGDDAPSREIPGEARSQPTERVKRILHFWQDGFSVDDGDLFRFDDPANAQILQQIRSGRAPLHIMNVGHGQEVDVQVVPHEENYIKPKSAFKPFAGQGNRLGSPTPGASASSPMPGSFTQEAPAASESAAAQPPTSQVDDSKPTVTLRISLGTGTRLTSRFNTDQTIGDVYDFVRRAEAGSRDFVLQTTFPIKEFTDESQVLGDISEFKRGGAIVQKYR